MTLAPGVRLGPYEIQSAIGAGGISHSPTISVAATYAGVILGTAAYMAPEQAKGKAVDKRADIWGFGCVLFEMLSGKSPFAGETITEGKWQVSRGGGSQPGWSPRGGELYYLSSESLVAIPIQPGATFTFGSPTPLIARSGYQFPDQARDYAVAPDGRFLLLKAPPSEGADTRAVPLHLVLVENWFEELRQRVPTAN
jgi:serine/threonine protein kinase